MKTQKEILDIPFPDTTELERQVLADAVSFPETIGDILPLVHPDFFTTTARREIWNTITKYYNEGKPIDVTTIGTIHGPAFMEEIYRKMNDSTPSGQLYHASILRDGAAKRRAYFAATTFLQNAISQKSTEQDILAAVEQFQRTVEGPAPLQNEAQLSAILNRIGEDIQDNAIAKKEGKAIRITTGFRQLDWWTYQGFAPGQLIILAARPSVGKTAVMLHMAKCAAKAGHPVYICSLEMTASELGQRMLFSTGKVTPKQVSNGDVDWQAFELANGELAPLPIYINDFSRSLDELVTRITQSVKQGHCKIAFIDYLGLIQDTISFGNTKLYQIISRITGTLKALAKRLGIPIVLLSQLNREQVKEKRAPELFDLRDSGSIEQDADIVLMLEPKPDEGRIYMWLRKNRNGKKDEALVLVPNSTYSSFEEGNKITELREPALVSQEESF